jgi:K+-transporting ATPase ATPase C chain
MYPRQALIAIRSVMALSLLTGLVYPLAITGLARVLFPRRADGSLLWRQGKVVGSALIGQPFASPRYFWGRPSATVPPYNAGSSAGSNLGPTNPGLLKAVAERVQALRRADPAHRSPVPVDMVTASGSGLDPEISLAAARYQAFRVAAARGLRLADVMAAVGRHTRGRFWGVLGEPGVNVLELNLDLDGLGRPGAR